ncbi:MAG: hypothetical protein ACI8Z7_000035 [Candidatus Nanohaloarchaea archaeon]|jgi:hypothetical protein
MERDTTVLTLLILTVVASGCVHSGGGDATITEGPESVTIQEVSVDPSQIYEGQNVRASLTAYNSGNLPAEVLVGENGSQMLTDYCPDIFDNNMDRFSASTSTVVETREGEGASYALDPGEKIDVGWVLQQEGNVPLNGFRCPMSFSVPFNYSVEAYRQVQIKQNREVEGSPQLNSESSSGPLVMAIETLPGATGRQGTYITPGGDTGDENIQLLIQMINEEPQEEYRKGLVDVAEESFYIRASEPLSLDEEVVNGEWQVQGDYGEGSEPRCEMPNADFRMYQGRSFTIQCNIPVTEDFDQPSVLSEITAGVNYTYIKDAGERTVEVQTRG